MVIIRWRCLQVVRVPKNESPVLNPVRMTRVALEAKGGWVSLEIRKVVADWFRWSEDNLGLVVQAVDADGNSLVVTDPEKADGSLVILPYDYFLFNKQLSYSYLFLSGNWTDRFHRETLKPDLEI